MIVIYYQNRETKKTYIREVNPDYNLIKALTNYRELWGNEYHAWLGVK